VETALMARFKKIHKNNQEILALMAEKQGKILKRLNERQKTVKKSKNFPY
jgi:hypothetical protein